VFWSVVAAVAAGLFPPGVQGKAVAGVLSGGTFGLLLGVPACTWIGQHAGWRVSFGVISAVGLAVAAAVAVLVPSSGPSGDHAAPGTHPDAVGYWLLLTSTFLAIAGTFTAYTFVSPFLTKVSGLASGDVPAVLLLGGLASLAGAGCSGLLLSRHPRAALVTPAAILAAALLGLYALGTAGPAAMVLQSAESFGVVGFAISMQAHVLIVAPRGADTASAGLNSLYNLGVATGPVIGGLVLSGPGLRTTALAGGLLASMALMVILGSPSIGAAIRRAVGRLGAGEA
jgi:predicted MFS family arabinose efflux permease